MWKDFKLLSRFMQIWIQPPACLDHGLHRILSSYWLAHFYLMKNPPKCCSFLVWIAGVTSCNPKNNWCLSCIFWARICRKDCGLSTCKPWSKQVGGWIHFCMNRLRTLNSYQIFKIKNKESKTYISWSPFQGLSNGTTLMQIHSGWTVPLSVSTLVRLKCFLIDQYLCIGQIEMFPQWPG